MFTGLIEKIGRIHDRSRRGDGERISIEHTAWDTPVHEGESVAVNGICLTVLNCAGDGFECDVLHETLDRTNLGKLAAGPFVNLERALRAGERIGGHFVTGHVDGVGTVRNITPSGEDAVVEIACGENLMRGIVEKGSVACDGISLTVAALCAGSFSVHIIPHTREQSTFGGLTTGQAINIELDMLGKYVERYLCRHGTS